MSPSVFHILFGTIAGVLADRWNRKYIMMVVNAAQALVTGALAMQIGVSGHVSRIAVFVAIFLLNTLNTFFAPSASAVMPEIVGREVLVTAQGLISMVNTVVNFAAQALAGIVVAVVGAAWAVGCDAISFLFPVACIWMAEFPKAVKPTQWSGRRPSFIRELAEGWKVIAGLPVVKALVWLGSLLNVASFAGPLTTGIVKVHLHSGAGIMGAIGAAGVVGGAWADSSPGSLNAGSARAD